MSRLTSAACAACLLLSAIVTVAAPPAQPEPDAGVQAALQAEAENGRHSRSDTLKELLAKDPASAEAHWQIGQVKRGDRWVDFKTLPGELAGSQALAEYRRVRADYPMTAAGQLKLADWCRTNKLPDREQAHLTVALELSNNPDNAGLRSRLGFRRVNGVWVKPDAIASLKQAQQAARKNLIAWRAKIVRLSKQYGSRRRDLRKRAEAQLRAIKDPAALPALEAVLSAGGLKRSELLVEIVSAMPTHKAADSLSRLAVLSPWDSVRKEAAKRLRTRSIESFAPELLATLRTPVDSRFGLFVGGGGIHLVQFASSETQGARQLLSGRSSTFIRTTGNASGSIGSRERARNKVRRATENAAVDAGLRARAAAKTVERQNAAVKAWNDRVCAVLADATGVRLPAEPAQWWEWWRDYNQLTAEPKPYQTYAYYQNRYETINTSEPTILPTAAQSTALPARRASECLVAGTPVWTDRGFVPVEEVKVGDLALAKHPDTGELTYRPVLRTTVRKPEPVYKVTTNSGTLRATGGHTFWVSGKGWTKLRYVKRGDRFHTATGSARVLKLEKDGEEKTYNLIVADVHTFFAGKNCVLTHDLTFAEPTDAIVPGLIPRPKP